MKRGYTAVVELSDEESTDSTEFSGQILEQNNSKTTSTTTNNGNSKLYFNNGSNATKSINNVTNSDSLDSKSKRIKYSIVDGNITVESPGAQKTTVTILDDTPTNKQVSTPFSKTKTPTNSTQTIENEKSSSTNASSVVDNSSTATTPATTTPNSKTKTEEFFSNFVSAVIQNSNEDETAASGQEDEELEEKTSQNTPSSSGAKEKLISIHNIDKDSSVPLSEKINDPSIIDDPKTNTFKCTKCSKAFQNKHGLFAHAMLSTEHNPENKRNWHVCTVCNQTYHPYSRHSHDKPSNDTRTKTRRKSKRVSRKTASSPLATEKKNSSLIEQTEDAEEAEEEPIVSSDEEEPNTPKNGKEMDSEMDTETLDNVEDTLEVRKDGFRCTKCDRTFTLRKGYWAHARYSLEHDPNNRLNWKACKVCAERYHPCGKSQHIKTCNPKNKQKNLELEAQLRNTITPTKLMSTSTPKSNNNNNSSNVKVASSSNDTASTTPVSSSKPQNSNTEIKTRRQEKVKEEVEDSRSDEKWFCKKCNRKFNSKVGYDGHMNFSVEHDANNRKNWKTCERCLELYHPYGKYRHDIGCKPLSKAEKEAVLAKRKELEALTPLIEKEPEVQTQVKKTDENSAEEEEGNSEEENNSSFVPLENSSRFTAEIPTILKEQEMHILFKITLQQSNGEQNSKILPLYNTISFSEYIDAVSGNFDISKQDLLQCRIQYKDEEGDWIDIDTVNDWKLGVLLFSRTLKKSPDNSLSQNNSYFCMKIKL